MIKLKDILFEIKIINSNQITPEMVDDLFDYIPILGHGDGDDEEYNNIKLKYYRRYLEPKGIPPKIGTDIARFLPKEGLINYYFDILKFVKKYGFKK